MIVGTVTLLFGAWIGCAKDDIKKVLAGSTMSQIGYMMLAAGIGPAGYAFAIFHLLTHGFFKANMFLGAGSVMHAMDDDVDMRHYGALARALPITFVTFAAGYLAIIGFPFFAGFYSKDHIIEAAFHASPVAGTCALIGAGVTAFYMTRLMLMTFDGQKRWRQGVHPHESPLVMTVPLIILGVASVVGGLVLNGWIAEWLNPAVQGEAETEGLIHFTVIGVVTMVVVLAGVAVSFAFFGPQQEHRRRAAGDPLALRPGRSPRPLRRRLQRGRLHATGHPDDAGHQPVRRRRGRRRRQRDRDGDQRLLRPAAPRPERLRPLVRPHHDRRRRRRRRHHPARPAGLRKDRR